ncbi:MAG: pitrilysin family protein [Verrucomicrobiota bacterium]|nr:pitrilysin family protein [Verrucomicrobiota bacterium]
MKASQRTSNHRTRKGTPSPSTPPPALALLFADEVRRWTLPNGMTVVHKYDASCPLASVQVWVKTGSIHEGPSLGSGLSHYLEHMLFKGTPRRGAGDIARETQESGGYINAYTTFDRTVYHIDLPSEHAAKAVDILADMALNATLDPDATTKEKDVILREIDMGLDDPDRQLSQALFSTAYRQHPYRQPVIGHRELFQAVTRDDLAHYYQGRYSPNNMTLVVVGDVTPEALDEALAPLLAKAARRRLLEANVLEEPLQLATREQHLEGDVTICRGGLAFKVPSLRHQDAPGLDLLAAILGRGASSILWQRLREKKRLVHSIDASCWNPGDSGLFWISYTCEPVKRATVTAAIMEELERAARDGFTLDMLEKARNQSVSSEINSRKTMSGQAARLGAAEVVIGDLGYTRRYYERLYGTTPDSLPELIRTHLVPERLTSVSLNSKQGAKATAKIASAHRLPDFEVRTLTNGARILLQPDTRLPKLCMRLVGLGGPIFEPADKRGVTPLLSAILTRDTEKRSAEAVAEAIERQGGSFSEFAGNNSFGLSIEVLPGDATLALEILKDAVLHPAFKTDTFERERDALIASIQEDNDEIFNYGKRALREIFFAQHPLAISEDGRVEDLKNMRVEDVRAHWQRLLTGSNTVLAVTGVYDEATLLPELESFLNALPGTVAPTPSQSEALPGHGVFTRTMAREQSVVFLAFPDCAMTAADFTAGELLDELFSDMAGRLFTKVREENSLAYFVGASRVTGLHTGMFFFYGGTHPDTAQQLLAILSEEAERARNGGLTQEELDRCRTRLKAAYLSQTQVLGTRAIQAALDTSYGLPTNTWRDRPAKLDALTLDDLHRFAKTYLIPEKAVTLIVGPESK